ncbi:alpha beta hydrolase : Alpha/beta hydrolase fold OS=Shewanella putrefaciens (strain CN-32 / ATCC BAA-453) GN=Sputcn32_1446 PE=4 SV=1: Abhydrolase_6 [Gemmataceae bacterium]|nr:alpha beta hydrolase : Alpha/beta hydrolase fold OS=Shewanella putrefaciens (strain CN-32 / ATCC BAA-453) GN=Sputcn32_1446 PE=4 SV=1: Abhydrolase_6 [Gemmataceae bacterium]VTU00045.1 alpha beta hydrolase : Alpha/beta hydrolase fold OS=Shewanella putrefaciens (strain CN-32 / ATCC BAA-453) GN=Sputcn32_1446 PE=4 SV=1: Abhydrolase_6 [Gemmataceae bacterium]
MRNETLDRGVAVIPNSELRTPNSAAYPFTPHRFPRPAGAMSYLDQGSGDPIVMVHGNPTWSYYYRNLVLALRDTHRCVAPDHIGCGLSDKPPVTAYDYALKSRVDDLEALLDHLGLRENLTLVVQDWGGMIGMAFAARHPERVKRIVATNTGAFPLPKSKPFPWSLWLGRNTRLGAWLILQKNAFCRVAAKWCVTRRPLPVDVRQMYLKPYDSPEHRVAVLKFVQTIPLGERDPGYDIVRDTALSLSKFANVPTLLLWGMRDFVFDRHFLADWQRYFPHAETRTWPDCGHYLLEDAGDEVIPLVREFLARHPIR